jgi:hypothetical protein
VQIEPDVPQGLLNQEAEAVGMIDSLEMLLTLLPSGQVREHRHTNVELTENWSQEKGKKLSSHANALAAGTFPVDVSWLVVGVQDCGILCGNSEEWAREQELQIAGHLREYLDPFQACRSLVCFETPAGWIVVLEIHSPNTATLWNGSAYKLLGTSTSVMSPAEFMGLTTSLPGEADFSGMPCEGPLDNILARRFCELVATRFGPEVVGNLRTLTGHGIVERLGLARTQAARILFGDCQYRVVRYDFDGEVIENVSQTGLARLLLPETQQALQRYDCLSTDPGMPLLGKTQRSTGRIGCPDQGLAEAMSNAVAHAAHFERDGDIVVEVWPDRISVSNLCVRESTHFANRWFSQERFTLNPLLMGALRLGPFVDELGLGKRRIYRSSIVAGKRPPIVEIGRAGRMCRWRLILFGGETDTNVIRLRDRLSALYKDDRKALIALALALWRDKPIEEIRNFLDEESRELVSQVAEDLQGPIFFSPDTGRIYLARWARVLLGEGKETRQLNRAEERRLLEAVHSYSTQHTDGEITPRELRDIAGLGDTNAARTMSSNVLAKWMKANIIKRITRGRYRFVQQPEPSSSQELRDRLEGRSQVTDA